MFPDVVALSPVVCAATVLITENPTNDRVAIPTRITNIANIAIVVIGKYEGSLVYKITNY
jgi:hypothetical protein